MKSKIKTFNSIANIYDYWYNHPQGRQVFIAEKNAIESMIPNTGLGLEIGAGTGIFCETLINNKRSILCLDPSNEMLRKAKNRELLCVQGVGDILPFRYGIFDFIYMITVLEFLDEPIKSLREIKITTKNNALFVILFINSDSSWGNLYRNTGTKGNPIFQNAKFYSLGEVLKLLNEANYEILSAKGTLNSDPFDLSISQTLVEPSVKSGVLLIKFIKRLE